jgi:hypothetical protein
MNECLQKILIDRNPNGAMDYAKQVSVLYNFILRH